MLKIAIVRLTSLGDVVFASFLPSLIKTHYKREDISIDWICDLAFADVIKNNPSINNILPLPIRALKKKQIKLNDVLDKINDYRKTNSYDIVIDIQGTLKSAIIAKLITRGTKAQIVGFSWFSIKEKLASLFYHKTYKISYDENIVKRNFELINFALKLNSSFKAVQLLIPSIYSVHNTFSLNNNLIGHSSASYNKICLIIPFSSKISKDIKQSKVIERLKSVTDTLFIINYASKNEHNRATKLIQYCHSNGYANITTFKHSQSIEQIKALLLDKNISLTVFGCDSGITHLASFCGRQTEVLFTNKKVSQRNILPLDIVKVNI